MRKERRGIIEEFRQFLPVTDKTPVVTLGEGGTPLVLADGLAKQIGFLGELYLKNEGANAGSGSFKDRGMTMAISKALEELAKSVICASTGNTLASAACYAAAAKNLGYELRCIGILPEGSVAAGKLVQALRFGAIVIQIRGNFDKAFEIAKAIAEQYPVTLVNSINPYRGEGQKTAAFEVWKELGRAPDYHFIPVGNAGNIAAHWMGYKEYKIHRREQYIDIGHSLHLNMPKMMGYQAAGAAPIVLGRRVKNPKTFASAIKIGNPEKWEDALLARDESGGKIDMVTDKEIRAAYDMIPRLTGIFCEPASAASVAGLIKAIRNGDVENKEGTVVVCTLTGNGLKDLDSALIGMPTAVTLDATPEAVAEFLKL